MKVHFVGTKYNGTLYSSTLYEQKDTVTCIWVELDRYTDINSRDTNITHIHRGNP